MAARTLTAVDVRRELRNRGFTQFDLAREVGLSQPWVSQVMRGHKVPSAENKARLEAAIADMRSTAVRVGERDGWDSPLYLAISRDIAKWEKPRARLLRSLEKYAA